MSKDVLDWIGQIMIAKYSWDEGHRIQWKKAEIYKKENRTTRKLKQLVFVRTTKQVINQAYM
jgi:hypothetical protein